MTLEHLKKPRPTEVELNQKFKPFAAITKLPNIDNYQKALLENYYEAHIIDLPISLNGVSGNIRLDAVPIWSIPFLATTTTITPFGPVVASMQINKNKSKATNTPLEPALEFYLPAGEKQDEQLKFLKETEFKLHFPEVTISYYLHGTNVHFVSENGVVKKPLSNYDNRAVYSPSHLALTPNVLLPWNADIISQIQAEFIPLTTELPFS